MKNKSIIKRMVGVFLAVVVMAGGTVSAFAAEEIMDLTRKGSLFVTMWDKGKDMVVPGGKMTLYPVAQAEEENGDFSFSYINGFEDCGMELGDLDSGDLAAKLTENIPEGAEKTVQSVDANGEVTFSDLPLGVYLLVQTEAAEGYNPVNPFVVSVPMKEGTTWIYDVDATPKMEPVTAKVSTPTPVPQNPSNTPEPAKPQSTTPGTPSGSSTLTGSTASITSLPQTGQLNWPIPVLTICGLLLFVFGWMMRGKKNEA